MRQSVLLLRQGQNDDFKCRTLDSNHPIVTRAHRSWYCFKDLFFQEQCRLCPQRCQVLQCSLIHLTQQYLTESRTKNCTVPGGSFDAILLWLKVKGSSFSSSSWQQVDGVSNLQSTLGYGCDSHLFLWAMHRQHTGVTYDWSHCLCPAQKRVQKQHGGLKGVVKTGLLSSKQLLTCTQVLHTQPVDGYSTLYRRKKPCFSSPVQPL